MENKRLTVIYSLELIQAAGLIAHIFIFDRNSTNSSLKCSISLKLDPVCPHVDYFIS